MTKIEGKKSQSKSFKINKIDDIPTARPIRKGEKRQMRNEAVCVSSDVQRVREQRIDIINIVLRNQPT